MNELEWLAARRPDTEETSTIATARARRALLEHALGPSPARIAGIKRRRRILAGGVLAAAAGIVAIASLPGGDGHVAPRLAPPQAQAAPLLRLAAKITQAPKPAGDATLVLRSHHLAQGHDFTGADLFLDNGDYYYGQTLTELKANAKADPTDQEGYQAAKAEREAAVAADTLPGDQARAKMIAATLAPDNSAPKLTEAQKAESAKAEAKARARKLAAAKKAGIDVGKPASPRSLDNNRVWIGSMDALIEGAGDPQVRAGVMKLMATMPEVKVEPHGGSLDLRMTDFPGGYQEILTVDAGTGVITKMTGGVAGQAPDVVVDYDIKRVQAGDVLG